MSSARISSVVGWVAALLDLVYIISLRCRDFRDAKFYFVSVTGPTSSTQRVYYITENQRSQIALKTGFREFLLRMADVLSSCYAYHAVGSKFLLVWCSGPVLCPWLRARILIASWPHASLITRHGMLLLTYFVIPGSAFASSRALDGSMHASRSKRHCCSAAPALFVCDVLVNCLFFEGSVF